MSPEDKIVDAAAEMFLSEGIKSVRMDDIATRLGVSKRTLYEMFGDKQDLLEQSVAYYFDRKRLAVCERASEATNVIEEIFFMLSSMRREDREVLLIVNLKKFYPEIYRRLEEEAHRYSYVEFDKLLDRGIEQGLFLPYINKELALVTLVYSISTIFERRDHIEFIKAVSAREAFRYVIVSFFRGLSTHKGIEVIDDIVTRNSEKQVNNNE